MPLELHSVASEDYGGKALELGRARRAGLPVPPGFALSPDLVERVVVGDSSARQRVLSAFEGLGPCAVRSSAIGEDGAQASFAGQHASVLNVRTREGLLQAVTNVYESARTAAALAYRRRLGINSEPRMAVVMQALIPAESAGILFTRNPLSGADERVIEGSFGLGEAVVAGLVTPDRFRLARGGAVLERALGEKDIAIAWHPDGGTHEIALSAERAAEPCLSDAQLQQLEALAAACERAFPGPHDLEWAFAGGQLYLLQRRAITRG
ncbi:MAG TPA: PEP/pyruvate-binding domain-containing protein [Polyangiaceae bacterium]|jgi:pyruvate,water dikinase|nr:PEP/pyruvate-binding domain-containing protein [Polyangiaceae bacterium]